MSKDYSLSELIKVFIDNKIEFFIHKTDTQVAQINFIIKEDNNDNKSETHT